MPGQLPLFPITQRATATSFGFVACELRISNGDGRLGTQAEAFHQHPLGLQRVYFVDRVVTRGCRTERSFLPLCGCAMMATMSAYDSTSGKATDVSGGSEFSAAMDWHGAAAVLVATGEVDMVTAPRLEKALTSALDERPEMLVVDLEEVQFFASVGLNALVTARQQAGEDTVVRVVATSSVTVRPLETTGLDREIPIYSSVELAVTED